MVQWRSWISTAIGLRLYSQRTPDPKGLELRQHHDISLHRRPFELSTQLHALHPQQFCCMILGELASWRTCASFDVSLGLRSMVAFGLFSYVRSPAHIACSVTGSQLSSQKSRGYITTLQPPLQSAKTSSLENLGCLPSDLTLHLKVPSAGGGGGGRLQLRR